MPLQVHIKHSGKTYPLPLDPSLPTSHFKEAIFQKTGVPVERMKVMVKGGVLKDDPDWSKIGPKDGQTFMVIGAAGELPKPPEKPVVFLEDMDDTELAEALAKPVGLTNLGNTCYMNATVQALRAIPELQVALGAPALQSTTPLPAALHELYTRMGQTTDSINPSRFLSVLREVNPQFAEMDRSEKRASDMMLGRQMYAQQDAEECYNSIINTLRGVPGLVPSQGPSSSSGQGASTSSGSAGTVGRYTTSGTGAEAVIGQKRFVEQWLVGEMRRELKSTESPDEPPILTNEQVLKVECNINKDTNFMLSGILNSLTQPVTKHSPTLNRDATYTSTSRFSRLPTYLTVHMVRFAWRGDIGKKAKIMRKVKFPLEFDALDICTDELKNKLLPASRKVKNVEKERFERRKVRRRMKGVQGGIVSGGRSKPAVSAAVEGGIVSAGRTIGAAGGIGGGELVAIAAVGAGGGGDVEMVDAPASTEGEGEAKGKEPAQEEEEDELTIRKREHEEFEKLVDEGVRSDVGACVTGLYDLVAIVTHKGAAADAGHYIGFVKKSVFYKPLPSPSPVPAPAPSEGDPSSPAGPSSTSAQNTHAQIQALDDFESDEDWYKFDDDKVSLFPVEKLSTLDGGGEDSSAYVLVYRGKGV